MKRTVYVAAVIAGLAGGAYAGTAAEQLGLDKTAAAQVAVAEVAPVPKPVTGKNSLVPQNHLTVPLAQAEIKNLIGIFDRVGVVATVENADCTTTRAVIDTRHSGFNPNKWSIAYGNIRAALTSAEIPSLVSLFDRLDVAPVANGIETVYQVTVKNSVCNHRPAVWTVTYDAKLTPAAVKSMADTIKDLNKSGFHNCDFYYEQQGCQNADGCHWTSDWNGHGSCEEAAQNCDWYNDQNSCRNAGCYWHEDFYSRGCSN